MKIFLQKLLTVDHLLHVNSFISTFSNFFDFFIILCFQISAGIVDEETEALRRRRAAGATNAEKQVK